jgi:arylsulfatase A-like enzyme
VNVPVGLALAATLVATLLPGGPGEAVAAVPAGAIGIDRADQRPNVVLIVADDMRLESLQSMPRTQRLLVDKGTRFTQGMVPTALCCPSRSTILTGLYSHSTRVFGNGDIGGPRFGGWSQFHRRGMEFRTIAVALDSAGYRTAFFGKYLNDFSRYAPDRYQPPGWDRFSAFKYSRGAYFNYRLTDGSWYGSAERDYSTDVLARLAKRFVRRSHADKPVFVMYAPYGPHHPFTPAPRHADDAVILPPTQSARPAAGSVLARVRPRHSPARTDRARWLVRREDKGSAAATAAEGQTRALLAVDEAVAGLVRTMKRTDRLRDTMFVFVSDNGYLWGEHGMVGKDVPYSGATRVPLVVRWDGRVPARRVDRRLALNVDLAGTIAEAANVRMRTEGLDLLGRRTRSGFALEAMAGYARRPAYCGWRTKHRMYVQWSTGREELFDYRVDPGEHFNLADDDRVADVKARMRAKAQRTCRPEPPGFDW